MTIEYNGLRLEEKSKDKWFVYDGDCLMYAICGDIAKVKSKIDFYSKIK